MSSQQAGFPTGISLRLDSLVFVVDGWPNRGLLHHQIWNTHPPANRFTGGDLYWRDLAGAQTMSIEAWGIIGAFLAGLGALIVSVRTSLNSVTQKELESLHKENERLQARVASLEGKLTDREERIEGLEKEIDGLHTQIRELQQENIVLREQLKQYKGKPRN